MKEDTHPTYYPDATVKCACGNEFTIGSTQEELEVEICSDCHPFYTGVEKVVDTAGRVEKFKQRQQKAEEKQQSASAKASADKGSEDSEKGEDESAGKEKKDLEDIKEEVKNEA